MQPSAIDASFATCEMLPLASLIATMFSTFRARVTAVSGRILQPVRLGTLYRMHGRLMEFAIAVKCAIRPF